MAWHGIAQFATVCSPLDYDLRIHCAYTQCRHMHGNAWSDLIMQFMPPLESFSLHFAL